MGTLRIHLQSRLLVYLLGYPGLVSVIESVTVIVFVHTASDIL